MGRFRVTITIAAGYSEDDADRLLEAALGVCPHRRPDSGHDSEHGAVSVTISDEATDALTASDHGTALTAHIFRTAGLPLRQLMGSRWIPATTRPGSSDSGFALRRTEPDYSPDLASARTPAAMRSASSVCPWFEARSIRPGRSMLCSGS